MPGLFLLISPRILGARNQFVRAGGSGRKRAIILGLVGAAFWAGLFIFSTRVLLYFQSIEMIGDLLAQYLLSMVLLTLFSLLLFSSMVTALSNLYLSSDLELCHATPVSVETLFVSRALYTLLDSSWMILIFGIPVLMAYGWVYRPGLGFYVGLVHVHVALAVIACGTGILVTMGLVHFFPARRTRDLLFLLSIVMIISLYILFRFLRPERLVNPEAFFGVLEYLSALKAPDSPYLPTHWMSGILWDHLQNAREGSAWFNILMTWSTAGAMVVFNIWAAHFLYYEGFSRSQEARKRRTWGARVLDVGVDMLTKPLRSDLGALISKDVRLFFRDNTQWSQLLLLGAIVVVYLYNFSVLPLDKSPMRLDFLQNQLAFLNMGLAGFVIAAVGVRFVYTAVSAEHGAYWVIRTSPMSLKRYLWGKYATFLVPMLLLAETLILLTNYLLEVTPFMMILTSITMFLMVFGIIALGIGLGARYPQFRFQNIGQVSTGFGGVLYMMLSILFIGVIVVLEAGPTYLLFMAQTQGRAIGAGQWAFIGLSFLAVLAIAVAAVIQPMRMGLKGLDAYE